MRIIAGEFKGRRLRSPADHRVRVTLERVREAWFSILGPHLAGARIVDLFAGSGVLGLEALSRGAEHVDFVELAAASLAALEANIRALGVAERTHVYRGDALRFARRLESRAYDLALADPPYETGQAERLCAMFREHPFAGILSVEHRATVALTGGETRRYGDVALTVWHAP